ncbi:glycosyltransferase [Paenibacillus sp. FSL R7-0302]|uniref:glycosyltransferase n=1 Tax=Paenibacillus sp. FSL R7-0302 TaxID=2921681 RepID=UPI0030F5FC51
MKIAIVGGFLFPYGDAAGARYRLLAKSLKKLNTEVYVISQLPYVPREDDYNIENDNYEFEGIRYESVIKRETTQKKYLTSSLNLIEAYNESAKSLENLIKLEGIDIILYSGNFNIAFRSIFKVARKYGVPVVNDVMEWFSSFVFHGGAFHPLSWDHEYYMRVINKRVDGLLVISSYLEKYYKKTSLPLLRVPSIGEFNNLPVVSEQKKDNNYPIKIGYYGTPSIKDGIYEMIQAINILSEKKCDFKFYLAGDDGRSGHLKKVIEIVNSNKLLSEKIVIMGKINQEDIPVFFSNCDILILTRPNMRFAKAGFPQKIPEYMSLGKPIVVTDVGDISMYVRHEVDGLIVKPNNPLIFANALEELINYSDNDREKMGLSAWNRGKNSFESEIHSKRILDFFSTIIDNKMKKNV